MLPGPYRLATALLVAASVFVGACGEPLERLPRPNVLLIVVDCLRADHVGVYGYERPTTPNLDLMAREGSVFENTFAQSHWTRPSVPSLLTGLYPSEHGMLDMRRGTRGKVQGERLAPEARTLAEDLRDVGYETALIGEQFQLAPGFGLNQGFDLYVNRGGRAPLINGKFERWLDRRDGEAPFFAYLHYLDAHWPYCPPKRFQGRFDDGRSTLRTCGGRRLRDAIRSGARKLEPFDLERLTARYDEELLAVDAALGGLFEALRSRGLWDDSLVIVTADHGEEFMEHGSIGHNTGLVDVLVSVPLVVKPPASWPGTPRARVASLVELRSVPATIRDAAGAAVGPGGPSLVPHLVGLAAPPPPAVIVSESSEEILVRSSTHALVVDRADGSMTLYDRSAELLERTDVIEEEPAIAAALRRHARLWRDGLEPLEERAAEVDEDTAEGLRALGYVD